MTMVAKANHKRNFIFAKCLKEVLAAGSCDNCTAFIHEFICFLSSNVIST
jgi:hypothetical protein